MWVMLEPIFFYDDYKVFVREAFAAREHGGRGQRQKLSRFLGCQDSYVSLVLNGERHFSVEQGEGLARFLRLGDAETEMLLNLLLMARAGNEETRRYYARRVQAERDRFLNLRSRLKIETDLSDADKAVYYGDVLHAKLHMALTIPGEQDAESLARRFRQPADRVEKACKFLADKGLILEKAGKYSGASKFLFVDRDSPFLAQHHTNWRLDAASAVQARREEDLHLSMTFTLSRKDAADLRLHIAQFLDSLSGRIKDSKEETLMALCVDYYEP